MNPIADAVTGLVAPIANLIDSLVTTDKEKGELKLALAGAQIGFANQVLDYELKIQQMQADVIKAEAQGNSWLQRSWRPITMLTFVSLIVLRWLGLAASNLSPELELELFSIVKLGLGGYVIGRSFEKVAPQVAGAISTVRIGKDKK